jgi:hypothetical protein
VREGQRHDPSRPPDGTGDAPDERADHEWAEAQVNRSAGTIDLGFRARGDQMS